MFYYSTTISQNYYQQGHFQKRLKQQCIWLPYVYLDTTNVRQDAENNVSAFPRPPPSLLETMGPIPFNRHEFPIQDSYYQFI